VDAGRVFTDPLSGKRQLMADIPFPYQYDRLLLRLRRDSTFCGFAPNVTGRKVEAAEAWQLGLCNRVVPAGQALHQEWAHGKPCIDDGLQGALRFSAGSGLQDKF